MLMPALIKGGKHVEGHPAKVPWYSGKNWYSDGGYYRRGTGDEPSFQVVCTGVPQTREKCNEPMQPHHYWSKSGLLRFTGIFAENKVQVISSLPYFTKNRTDSQRGDGVFEDSIKALHRLNAVGYGIEGSGLILDLVYNPSGAFYREIKVLWNMNSNCRWSVAMTLILIIFCYYQFAHQPFSRLSVGIRQLSRLYDIAGGSFQSCHSGWIDVSVYTFHKLGRVYLWLWFQSDAGPESKQ